VTSSDSGGVRLNARARRVASTIRCRSSSVPSSGVSIRGGSSGSADRSRTDPREVGATSAVTMPKTARSGWPPRRTARPRTAAGPPARPLGSGSTARPAAPGSAVRRSRGRSAGRRRRAGGRRERSRRRRARRAGGCPARTARRPARSRCAAGSPDCSTSPAGEQDRRRLDHLAAGQPDAAHAGAVEHDRVHQVAGADGEVGAGPGGARWSARCSSERRRPHCGASDRTPSARGSLRSSVQE
jgi:hypothetical protein